MTHGCSDRLLFRVDRKARAVELYQVEYFVVLAKTLNFTRAAEQCGVTQSALTRGIQRLERELGGELLFRERHLTQLTELGKAVLPMLRKTSEAATAARRSAHEYRRKAIAPLRLGFAPTISANLIVGLLTEVVAQAALSSHRDVRGTRFDTGRHAAGGQDQRRVGRSSSNGHRNASITGLSSLRDTSYLHRPTMRCRDGRRSASRIWPPRRCSSATGANLDPDCRARPKPWEYGTGAETRAIFSTWRRPASA